MADDLRTSTAARSDSISVRLALPRSARLDLIQFVLGANPRPERDQQSVRNFMVLWLIVPLDEIWASGPSHSGRFLISSMPSGTPQLRRSKSAEELLSYRHPEPFVFLMRLCPGSTNRSEPSSDFEFLRRYGPLQATGFRGAEPLPYQITIACRACLQRGERLVAERLAGGA